METNKEAVIYCRVSTKEQVEEGNSLATQEKICKDYALKNGYQVAEIFIEQGESAKTQNRTELQKMMRFCADRKNKIVAVIIYKIDRMSRNTDDYSQIRILLKQYGVEIKSTSEYFENTPAGRFMENMIANVAQFDNDVRTERSVNGMRDAVREGRYVWGAPIGYSNLKVGGKSTIAPNDTAPIVKKAFELLAQNTMSLEEVRQQVLKDGLIGKSGRLLSKSAFYAMFNNQLYCGWIIKFGEKHKGLFEPIVTEELFGQVQWILKRKNKRGYTYKRENPDFPLRRFVRHTSGLRLTGSWAKGRNDLYAYYRFMTKGMLFPKEEMEKCFMKFLNQYRLNEKHLVYFKKAVEENLVFNLKEKIKERNRLQAYVIDLKERQSSIIQKNFQGIINNNILKEQLDIIENEIQNAQIAITNLPNTKSDIPELLDFISEYLNNPSTIWNIAPFQQKLRLQWFEFPLGVTFNGKEFQTAEIANIFKVKNLFLVENSCRVDSANQFTNNPHLPTIENELVVPTIEQELFWQKVGKDIVELSDILLDIEDAMFVKAEFHPPYKH